MTEPLHLSFVVSCGAEHAFSTWTQKASLWWPADHTVSGEPGLEVVFEPRVGGRIFERTAAGREIDWGEVTVWDPPRRVRYLWHLRAERTGATDVEIVLTKLGESATRIDIEHRGWDRLGAAAPARREANRSGWESLLPHYLAACTGREEPATSVGRSSQRRQEPA